MNVRRLVVLVVLGAGLPALMLAQKREDFLSIQRDVAQVQDQLKQMQASQDQKMDAIQNALKQALEESAKLSAALAVLQTNINDRLADQQAKVVAPVATLGSKVDELATDTRAVRENVADLGARLGKLDNKLEDISSAVRTLNTPTSVAPPPPAGAPPGTAAGPPPPPGVSADSLWQNALRDRSSGKDELAMNEFSDFVKYFPMSENAPIAQYYIGDLYDRAKQYEDAVQAFDAVLERYPENSRTPDALYMKGVDLMKAGRRTDSATEFKDFLERYPTHALAPKAQAHLKELGVGAAKPAAPRAKKKAN
ncbi:MAG: tetratricopeptide repeat protein [Bryobacteraceae bacterium]